MYPPAPAAPPPPPAAASILPRLGTTVWRLVVAGCAFFGVFTVAYDPLLGWRDLWFLSQLGSLVAAILYFLMAPVPLLPTYEKLEPAVAWVRGSLASMMLLICIASIFILGSGDLDQTGFLFEHLLTPLIVAVDFAVVGRFAAKTRAWHPVTWIGMPLVYLIAVNLAGETDSLYGGILSPTDPQFAMYVGMFLATAIVFGYLLFGLAKLRGVIAGGTTIQQAPGFARQPGPYGAQPYPTAAPQSPAFGGPAPQFPAAGAPAPHSNVGYGAPPTAPGIAAPGPLPVPPAAQAASPYGQAPSTGQYASAEGEYDQGPIQPPRA